jgi:HD superfamily phosphohydrolase
MDSSQRDDSGKLIVDSIHGDIRLTKREVDVIDTPSFQRLRRLKQLAMAQMVYPTATHTRFAHSIGALGMMIRILDTAEQNGLDISEEQREQLRLAALLHDVGHYPYSHLMEGLDSVELTEDVIQAIPKTIDSQRSLYPKHDELGSLVVTQRPDLLKALGGPDQAKIVADIFTRSIAADAQLSKLVHSSFDIDRWDYLWRDSHATGVPYGHIDINYLLNNLRASSDKILGFSHKALPAIEHFLLARFFMYRAVYYHKTIFGLEEACRQLLRRLRDRNEEHYGIPLNGDEVKDWVKSDRVLRFTDALVDDIVQKAVDHKGDSEEDKVIRALARSIQSRRPPILLKEVQVCEEPQTRHHAGTAFFEKCRNNLKSLSEEFCIPLGQFILCSPNVTIMKEPRQYRASEITSLDADELRTREHEEEEEQIWIFEDEKQEPESFWDMEHSLVGKCAKYFVQSFRVYVVLEGEDKDSVFAKLCETVKDWAKT